MALEDLRVKKYAPTTEGFDKANAEIYLIGLSRSGGATF
jgi:hypothetical protein